MPVSITKPTVGGSTGIWGQQLNDNLDAIVAAINANTEAVVGKATLADIQAAIATLVGGAPGILDTLGEIAAQLAADESAAGALATAVNARYTKPGGGIPAADLAAAVQALLGVDQTARDAAAAAVTTAATDASTKATAAQTNATTAAATDASTKAATRAPVGLPAYAPATVTRRHDPTRSAYGATPAALVQFRTALGKARAGLGLCHILAIGDSLTDGYMGSAAAVVGDPLNAYPQIVKAALLASGVPSAGTGWVKFSSFNATVLDPRWSTTGTWNRAAATYGYTTAVGATATLTLPGGGATNVDVETTDLSAAWTYEVRNTANTVIASGALAKTNTAAMRKLSLTGLVDAATLTITAVSGTTIIVAANIYKLTGLLVSNFAYYGTRASGTSGWESDATYYNPGSVAVAAVPAPDLVLGTLGTNDKAGSVTDATLITALTTTFNRWPNASRLLIGPWQAGGFSNTVWNATVGGLYTLADTLGAALFDMYDRTQGYAAMNARGLFQDSTTATHPNQAAHQDAGRAIADLVAGAGGSATPDVGAGTSTPARGFNISRGWGDLTAAKLTATGKVSLAVLSDSWAYMYASDLVAKGWVGLLRSRLQATFGDGGSGFRGVADSDLFLSSSGINATARAVWAAQANAITTTGTWAAGGATGGPGCTYLNSTATGSTITFPAVRGTQVSVYFLQTTSSGAFTCTIDGVAQGSVTTAAGANGTSKITATVAGPGPHTVVITTSSASATLICGVSGENTAGVVVNDFHRSGAQSTLFNNSDAYGGSGVWSGGDQYPADMILWCMGINDAATGNASSDVWQQNLQKYLTRTGQNNGTAEVAVVSPHIGKADLTNYQFQGYAARALAAMQAAGGAHFNMWANGRQSWDYWSTLGYWASTTSPGAAGSDTVHMSDAGHAYVDSVIGPQLVAALRGAF